MFTFLPQSAKTEVESEYRKRVLTSAFGLSALVIFAGAALALPAFMNLSIKHDLSVLSEKKNVIADADIVTALERQVKDISSKTITLKTVIGQNKIIPTVELLSSKLTAGVTLDKVTIKRVNAGSIVISGTAGTRDALVSFSKSLQGEASWSGVSLPISSLAKSRNIGFSISINSHI